MYMYLSGAIWPCAPARTVYDVIRMESSALVPPVFVFRAGERPNADPSDCAIEMQAFILSKEFRFEKWAIFLDRGKSTSDMRVPVSGPGGCRRCEWRVGMCRWGSSGICLRLSSSLSGQSQYAISETTFGMTRSSAMEQEAKANLDVSHPK